MKSKVFYLELLCRSTGYDDRPDCGHINLPIAYAWQEDPDDLHIQFNTPFGREHGNVCPEIDEDSGDYVIPVSDWLLKHLGKNYRPKIIRKYKWTPDGGRKITCDAVQVYHLGWVPEPTLGGDGGVVAPKSYIEHIENHWNSPNR